jgi:hypothetical protein
MRTLEVRQPPMRGADVKTLQTLLRKRGYLKAAADGVYGPVTAHAVYQAKLALGYLKPDHAAGSKLDAYLAGKLKPTQAMAARARKRPKTKPGGSSHTPTPSKAQTRETVVRSRAVAVMHVLLHYEPNVHYRQARPMRSASVVSLSDLEHRLQQPAGVAMDCSESVTLIARLAGAKNPNGGPYTGQGFTGTILRACKRIGKTQLRPADLIVFGPGTGHHVVTVLEPGPDPLVFSHGQERGPLAIRLSQEARFQPGPVTYLRLPT